MLIGTFYKLHPTDSSSYSGKDFRRLFWGACVNGQVYINAEQLFPDLRAGYYVPIRELGRYCFISFLNDAGLSTKAGAIVNINNGGVFWLTVTTMRELLAKDAEILSRYNDTDP